MLHMDDVVLRNLCFPLYVKAYTAMAQLCTQIEFYGIYPQTFRQVQPVFLTCWDIKLALLVQLVQIFFQISGGVIFQVALSSSRL